jgi:hypothetical protein
MHTRKATKYVGMKQRSCRLNQIWHTGNTRNQPTCLCWTIRSVNQVWTSLPSGLPLSQQKSRNYSSVKCSFSGEMCTSYVGNTRSIASLQWWFLSWYFSGARPHMCGASIIYFFLALANGLCCVWLVYPTWGWHRCPEIGTSSIDWAQLSRFYLKTETEYSLRNVVLWKINKTVFLDKDRTMDNVQKHNICTTSSLLSTVLVRSFGMVCTLQITYVIILIQLGWDCTVYALKLLLPRHDV